ncbi:hypothetical protein [Sphingobacterium sp.]|uniref:hypothetical protein n=1 Tax=Sphingobacterium sp. TaxID=341027 RepID=UPI0031E1D724
MNQKYSNVLALELALYEIHNPEYDPIKKITDFWEKYNLIDIQNTLQLLLRNHTDSNYMDELYVLRHKKVFSADLYRLLIAYFIIHTDHSNISDIDIFDAESTQISREELIVSKRIHNFFSLIKD